MKKLITRVAFVPVVFLPVVFLPGVALAHGGHASLPAEAHATAHAAPWLALAVIAVAAVLMVRGRRA